MQSAFDLVWNKLSDWGRDFIALLPNIAVAVLVILVFWGIGRSVQRLLDRGLRRTPLHDTAVPIIAKTVAFVVLSVGLVIALGILNLQEAAASLLAGAGIVGLVLGLAFQDIAANYFAGFMLSLKRPLKIGDVVETNEEFGTVERIELRTTWIRTFEGQRVMIPNRKIFAEVLTNFSTYGRRRVDLPVGVSYGEDLERAERVALAAVAELDCVLHDEPPTLFFEAFGDSSIDFQIRFWAKYARHADYLEARHAAVKAIKRAFDENGITIPFPIRTLDFGIVGGKTLGEVLPRSGGNGERRRTLVAERYTR